MQNLFISSILRKWIYSGRYEKHLIFVIYIICLFIEFPMFKKLETYQNCWRPCFLDTTICLDFQDQYWRDWLIFSQNVNLQTLISSNLLDHLQFLSIFQLQFSYRVHQLAQKKNRRPTFYQFAQTHRFECSFCIFVLDLHLRIFDQFYLRLTLCEDFSTLLQK